MKIGDEQKRNRDHKYSKVRQILRSHVSSKDEMVFMKFLEAGGASSLGPGLISAGWFGDVVEFLLLSWEKGV